MENEIANMRGALNTPSTEDKHLMMVLEAEREGKLTPAGEDHRAHENDILDGYGGADEPQDFYSELEDAKVQFYDMARNCVYPDIFYLRGDYRIEILEEDPKLKWVSSYKTNDFLYRG